jgi:hypothetical protein
MPTQVVILKNAFRLLSIVYFLTRFGKFSKCFKCRVMPSELRIPKMSARPTFISKNIPLPEEEGSYPTP